MDKDLLQYCKDNDFPVNEMSENDFKKVENSTGYKCYELGLKLRELGREILKTMEKREHRKKSCKNFKCK